MNKFALLAIIATTGIAGIAAAPAMASTTVPYCSTSGGDDSVELQRQKDSLISDLRLLTKPFYSVDVWNGCFKVIVTDSSGQTTTSFYDPDSLRLLGTI